MIEKQLTPRMVADLLGYPERRARRLMASGKIKSRREGSRWYTTESKIEAFLDPPEKPERPWGVLRPGKRKEKPEPFQPMTYEEFDAKLKAEGRYPY